MKNQPNVIYHTNSSFKKENPYDHINRYRKGLWQNPTFIHHKNSHQIRNKKEGPQSDKGHQQKPITTIILINERLRL